MKTTFIRKAALLIPLLISIYTQAQVSGDSTGNIAGDTTHTLSTITAPKEDSPKHLYRINYWVSGSFCLVATAADIYAIPYVIKAKKTITDQELAGLNPNVFTGFDRYALQQDPSKMQQYRNLSDYTLPVLIATPAFLAFDDNIRHDWFRLLVMYYEMHAITFSLYNYSFFGPAFQNKYRPITYYTQLPVNERNPGNNRNSMYSGHEATALASTYFLVKVYCDYHPEIGRKKYLYYAIATIPPLVEGYFRVKGMEHFPSDVMVGLAIGAACGVLVPEVHRFKNHKVQFGMSAVPNGAGLNMTWNMDQR